MTSHLSGPHTDIVHVDIHSDMFSLVCIKRHCDKVVVGNRFVSEELKMCAA